jgi:hypothetical protein
MGHDPSVSDRVNARIQGVQPPEADPVFDLRGRETKLHELGERDHPELAGGDPSDNGIDERPAPVPTRMPFSRIMF